ncbi:MAG: rRNA maturation RNase YbeY [Gemmatimonadales bacterium]|nr:rRNA maturation RNase YbeY [Gemmatimonadales bacterium]
MAEVAVGGRRHALPAATVRRIVQGVLAAERRAADISVTFLGRDAMRRLNQQYKQHDAPTDVIAFTLTSPDGRLVGDVYVCPWYAARTARRLGIGSRQEMIRILVHGVLHVLGYDHPHEDRTRSPMWRRQERYVERFA